MPKNLAQNLAPIELHSGFKKSQLDLDEQTDMEKGYLAPEYWRYRGNAIASGEPKVGMEMTPCS